MVLKTIFGAALCLACVGAPVYAAGQVSTQAEVSPAEAVVEAQLVAYNKRDLEAFLGYYADDAILANYPNEVTQAGKEAMRTRYRKSFANLNVRAAIVKRIAFGNMVIDHEQLTAAPAPGMSEAIAIYEVKDGKIVRVTFIKK